MRFETVQHGFFLALLLLVTLAFFGLIQDLLKPLFWAAVLAVLFHRVHKRLISLLRGHTALAAALTIILVMVIVIFPLLLVGAAVTREAALLVERISSGNLDFLTQVLRFAEEKTPLFTDYLNRFGGDIDQIQERFSGVAVTIGGFLASKAVDIGQNALRMGVFIALMIYVLFFFLRDGDRMVETLIGILPLGDVRERRLLAKFAEVSRATIKGVLVVAIIQGGLGGLTFWFLGIGAPVFWGMIMTVFSLLPAVGPAIVWVPAVVILMISGEVIKGIILLAGGTLIIGLVDNVLRPILVGRDTRMPDFLVLLSTIGGLAVFGISGFVIGPIIAALFLAIWEIFGEVYVGEETPESKIDPGS